MFLLSYETKDICHGKVLCMRKTSFAADPCNRESGGPCSGALSLRRRGVIRHDGRSFSAVRYAEAPDKKAMVYECPLRIHREPYYPRGCSPMPWCGFIVIALRGPDYDTQVHFLRALYVTGCLLLAGRAHLVPHSPAQGGEGIERKVPGRGQVAKRYGGEAINCRPGPLSNLADFRDDHLGIRLKTVSG